MRNEENREMLPEYRVPREVRRSAAPDAPDRVIREPRVRPAQREVRRTDPIEPARAVPAAPARTAKPKRKGRKLRFVILLLVLLLLAALGHRQTTTPETAPAPEPIELPVLDDASAVTPEDAAGQTAATSDAETTPPDPQRAAGIEAAATALPAPTEEPPASDAPPFAAAQTARSVSAPQPTPAATQAPRPASTPQPTPAATQTPRLASTPEPSSEPHVHVFSGTVVKAATCTAPGDELCTCACGAVAHRTIPALGHDWGTYTDAAGNPVRQCVRCGETARAA